MREQRVACGQFRAVPGDREANLRVITRQIAEAGVRGCSLIVFPEMAVTGYLPPSQLPALAESVDGESISTIATACAEHGVGAVVGFPELDAASGVRHNSFVFLSGDGSVVGVYRKVHLWDTEQEWAAAGTEVPVFTTDAATYSGWICFDTRFPEIARLAFLAGAEVCFVPTAWLGPASEWELSLRARALESACFVVGSDLVNTLAGLECRGHSMIVGPYGNVLARAQPMTEGIVDAVLDPRDLERQRERLRIRESRRPELYGPVASRDCGPR
jgi:predicted amidohydrolase